MSMGNAAVANDQSPEVVEVVAHVVKYDVTEGQIQELRQRFSGLIFETAAKYEEGRKAIATQLEGIEEPLKLAKPGAHRGRARGVRRRGRCTMIARKFLYRTEGDRVDVLDAITERLVISIHNVPAGGLKPEDMPAIEEWIRKIVAQQQGIAS